jgi:ubiquitin-like modifier-activating enzyme ATG7
MPDDDRCKFTPFSSTVDAPFWVRYNHEKLERIRLSEAPISLQASYGVEGPRLRCQESSLQQAAASVVPNERVAMPGQLIGFNTVEAFQTQDKNQILHDLFCPAFLEGDLAVLTSFVVLTYADLKNHKVLYWFGIPALLNRSDRPILVTQRQSLATAWTGQQVASLATQIQSMRASRLSQSLPPYFLYYQTTTTTTTTTDGSPPPCQALSKEAYTQLQTVAAADDTSTLIFGCFDPVGFHLPADAPVGWPIRNLIAYLSFHLGLGGQQVTILSYRVQQMRRLTAATLSSLLGEAEGQLLTLRVPAKEDYQWDGGSYKVVGWELNARSKPGPRSVNLQPLLDPKHLAIQAADLNLKLMKWRMIPDLQIDLLQSRRVLLIGAGTLGCNVARVLVGWGIRKLKFVDYGKVSYSNPVRQPLFTLDDCTSENGGGRSKAEAAAAALRAVAADVESEGIVLSIPMPGHVEKREAMEESVRQLDALVQEADVIFLLTDTRESRWLPTVMAAAHDKIMINAALGLDSWLVMRHGGGVGDGRLGCYFCNDVVAPENSTKNRTLDQQCTVTRPGLAPIASSMAVEMMVSLLHHPQTVKAPAPAYKSEFSPTVSQDDSSASALGVIPHQVRGSLVSYTMMTPTVPAFTHCTGCAAAVVEAYKKDPTELVFQTCQSTDGSFLESVSGLAAFRAEAAEKLGDVDICWDDDEFDE